MPFGSGSAPSYFLDCERRLPNNSFNGGSLTATGRLAKDTVVTRNVGIGTRQIGVFAGTGRRSVRQRMTSLSYGSTKQPGSEHRPD